MPEQLQGGYYDHSEITVHYTRSEGLLQMPVGAARVDGSVPCRVARVHAPVMTKVVTVLVSKEGGLPRLPNHIPNDTNLVLMEAQVSIVVPEVRVTGAGHSWAQACTYIYAMRKPLQFGKDDLPTGIQPYSIGNPQENRIPASSFQNNLLDGHAGNANQLPPQQLTAT